jgi:hypothetical protein
MGFFVQACVHASFFREDSWDSQGPHKDRTYFTNLA